MRRLIRRSRADSSVREDTRSYLTDSINLFIRRKRNKRYIKRYIRTRKSLPI